MYLVSIDKFAVLIDRRKEVSVITRFVENRCKISGIMAAFSKRSVDVSDLSPKKKPTKRIHYQEYRYEYGEELHKKLYLHNEGKDIAIFLTYKLDFHGFSRHSGGTFSGIMFLYRRGRKGPLLPTKPFLVLLLLYFWKWVYLNS